jgi:hypothetical protein
MGLLVLVRLAGIDQDDVAALDLLLRLKRLDLLDRPTLGIRTSGRHQAKSPKFGSALLQKV